MLGAAVKVLYIAGVGRSGSTLLERMLGAVPGSVNAGELNAIFSRVAPQDQRCGCGEPFSRCPFWTAVGTEAFGGWAQVTARMSYLQPRLVRQRHVPRLVTGVAAAPYRRELDEYLDAHHRLYEAIAAVSGAEVIVDASKSTAQLFALRRIGALDLRVINLVRDSRGVANSWNKAGIVKPQSKDGADMGTYAPHRLAVLWAALQLECAVLRAAAPYSARVRYEDLVARPRPTLERALSEVGLAAGRAEHWTTSERAASPHPEPRGCRQPDPVHRRPHRADPRRRLAVDALARGPPRRHRHDPAAARRLRLRRTPTERRTDRAA